MQVQRARRTVLLAFAVSLPLSLGGAVFGPSAALAATTTAAHGARVDEPAYGSFLAGMVAGVLGQNEVAAGLLLDALAHDPRQKLLQQSAFLFSTLAGRPEAAALAAKVPPSLITQLVVANDAVRRGDWATAAKLYAGLPRSPLNDLVRPLLLAWAQQGAGHTDLALKTLSGLGNGGPLGGTASLEAAEITDLAGRVKAAATAYQMAETFAPGANLALTQALGSYLVRHGQADEGRQLVRTLAGQITVLGLVAPRLEASLAQPPIADARQGLARTYLAIASMVQQQTAPDEDGTGAGPDGEGNGGREAEMFMLRFALDLQPALAPARLMMAELQAASEGQHGRPGDPESAIRTLSAIPPQDPFAPLAALRIATLTAVTGRRDEAVRRLQALAAEHPDRPEPAQALGDVLSDAKRWTEAAAAYDKAIAAREALAGPLAGDDWQLLFARGVALDRANDWTRAQGDLRRALALSPNQPYVLNYLGYSMLERNLDAGQARTLIQRALDARPDDGAIRDSLGWAMLRGGDVSGAIRTLERAAEQTPEDPEVNYHLGVAYWRAGRHVEALDQWRWALVLHPEPGDEAKIRTALHDANAPGAPSATLPATR